MVRTRLSRFISFFFTLIWQWFAVVLEFDKNEVLIDALGGEIAAPVWMYQTNL